MARIAIPTSTLTTRTSTMSPTPSTMSSTRTTRTPFSARNASYDHSRRRSSNRVTSTATPKSCGASRPSSRAAVPPHRHRSRTNFRAIVSRKSSTSSFGVNSSTPTVRQPPPHRPSSTAFVDRRAPTTPIHAIRTRGHRSTVDCRRHTTH